ncbi:hypothetical protein C0Q70_14382 [Pomacea canaliculata]|uniref:HAT C-terminal dimerisation domain-containing protein n=1 Tax=Pomacea canaliculata TaxID=400727 RepID=A0A2T7NZV6_POMCA|nr:hypothetical protein C0Q70_14382 [Pomacea canaliculata]
MCITLGLWCHRLDRREFDSFPTLNDFLVTSPQEIDEQIVANFKSHLHGLREQFRIYFPEPETKSEWIRNPFANMSAAEAVSTKLSSRDVDSLVELALGGSLKVLFAEKCLTDFWLHARSEYGGLADIAVKHLLPFPTTYYCEIRCSTLVGLKTNKRSRLNVESDMRLKLSNIAPDITTLISRQKQLHSSHYHFNYKERGM